MTVRKILFCYLKKAKQTNKKITPSIKHFNKVLKEQTKIKVIILGFYTNQQNTKQENRKLIKYENVC
jgi:hypothetical protein